MTARVLLYGASGYTGQLLAHQLSGRFDDGSGKMQGLVRRDNFELVLGGRNPDKVRVVADRIGLSWRAFDLANAADVRTALADIDVVIHAAGPFSRTALPLAEGCIAAGAHYLDVGGEWPVYPEMMARHDAALAAGITLMPGAALTVGGTECLMLRAVERWPDTARLCVGISIPEAVSRGSLETVAELAHSGTMIRRGGALVSVPAGSLTRMFDFGRGPSEAAATNWAEIVTAGETTGVPDIEIYSEMHWSQRAAYRAAGIAVGLTDPAPFRMVGGLLTKFWPRAPEPAVREAARYTIVVEALDPWRRVRRMTMRTLDGYGASVRICGEVLHRVLRGEAPQGFTTPARAFGSNLVVDAGAALFLDEHGPAAAAGGTGA